MAIQCDMARRTHNKLLFIFPYIFDPFHSIDDVELFFPNATTTQFSNYLILHFFMNQFNNNNNNNNN